MTSSHIVLTEPVPDVLEEIGWTGGECMTDGRTLLHYFRTTRDGRIVFGWGGGSVAYGGRLNGRIEVDPDAAAGARRNLLRYFPALEGRTITHAWGGPIDVSPSHLPQIGTLPDAPVHYALGYTGNGKTCTFNFCDLTGTWAVRTRTTISWTDLYANVPFNPPVIIQAGTFTGDVWELRKVTYDGTTVNNQTKPCGGTYPDAHNPF